MQEMGECAEHGCVVSGINSYYRCTIFMVDERPYLGFYSYCRAMYLIPHMIMYLYCIIHI